MNQRAGKREWIGLAVIALPCMLYSMDLTVLNLAIPALSRDLEPTATQLLWIIDVYGFLVAGWLITMGTLGDRIGRRKLLLIGAAFFGATSVFAAFARSAEMLIFARALLGLAGATVAPSTLSLIRNMFHDDRQRTVAIGIWITAYSAGAALGPFAGGLLLEHYWWGSVFLLAVPVMVLLLVVGPFLLPEYKDPAPGKLDLLSTALSLAAVLLVIWGLKDIAQDGPAAVSLGAIATGVALGVVFIRRQRRLEHPHIDVELFRAPSFSVALLVYLVGAFVSMGVWVFNAQYLQLVLGLSPLKAGLATMPGMAAFIIGTNLCPPLTRRFSHSTLMTAGFLLATVGYVMLTRVSGAPGDLQLIIIANFIYSLGLSPVVTLPNDIILSAAPPERAGSASAISETGAEMGGAVGIAILGSIGTAIYRAQVTPEALRGVPADVAEAASHTLGGAVVEAEGLPADVAAQLLETARGAFLDALQLTAVIAALLCLVSAIAVRVALRSR